jgi:type IV secretory pathway TraG/TraD family ATPase VirD4
MKIKLTITLLLLCACTAAPAAGQSNNRQTTAQRLKSAQQYEQSLRQQQQIQQQKIQQQQRAQQDLDWQRRGEAQRARISTFVENATLWLWRIAGIVVALIVGFLLYWLLIRRRKTDTSHGSAAWGAPGNDLKQKFGTKLPDGAFFLAPSGKKQSKHYLIVPREIAVRHGIIIGGTGTGKSRGYFMPTLAYGDKCSAVVTDIKYELWKMTSGLQQRVCRLAPADPDQSGSFNFVALCRDKRVAELCAEAIVINDGESFWADTETQLLTALFSHVAHSPTPTPAAVYDLLTLTPTEDLIEQLSGSVSVVARRQANLFKSNATDPKTRANIITGTVRSLKWLEDDNVRRFTSASLTPPNFRLLKQKPVTIYWSLRKSDVSRLKKLTAIFFTVLFEQLEEAAGDIPITMMLDEVGNIGTIPHFASIITLARGRDISIWLGLQAPSQLDAGYGHDNAKTIFQTCATKIILSGADLETAKYVSETLGEATISTPNKSTSKASHHGGTTTTVTKSQHVHARRLMTPDEVRTISEDSAIVIMSNRPPLHVDKLYYDEAASAVQMRGLGQTITINEPLPTQRTEKQSPFAAPPPLPEGLM